MTERRQIFLTEQWQAYPAFPKGFEKEMALRFSQISGRPMAKSILLSPSRSALEISSSEIGNILKPDDWVAARLEKNEIVELFLLAPSLAEPLKLSSNPDLQKKWFQFLAQVRNFFEAKGFSQAQTPTVVACPGTEPFLDLFSTEQISFGKKKKMFLTTSPEIHLKKMLSAGYQNIFEIKNCFRNGEQSKRHTPEFSMLEWYRSFANLEEIIQDCINLIEHLHGKKIFFQRKSMAQLFEEKLNFKLTPQTTIVELKQLGAKHSLKVEDFQLWDDVFYFIFIEKIENDLVTEVPLVLEKYPPSQAAFARLTEDGWGDRFEIYWKGLELGNAFHELNDPKIQSQRFREDLEKKAQLGKEIPELDAQFMQALESGMPPSAGIAMGLERLFMALHGISKISDIKVF